MAMTRDSEPPPDVQARAQAELEHIAILIAQQSAELTALLELRTSQLRRRETAHEVGDQHVGDVDAHGVQPDGTIVAYFSLSSVSSQ